MFNLAWLFVQFHHVIIVHVALTHIAR